MLHSEIVHGPLHYKKIIKIVAPYIRKSTLEVNLNSAKICLNFVRSICEFQNSDKLYLNPD